MAVASVQPSITAIQELSSVFAVVSKLKAAASVQPSITSIQVEGSNSCLLLCQN